MNLTDPALPLAAHLISARAPHLLLDLWGRMRIAPRLALVALVLQIPILVLGYAYIQDKLGAIQAVRDKQAGLEYLAPLGQLMTHVAAHRGLTNVFLHGNPTVLPRVDEVAAKIDQHFLQL